MAKKAKVSLEKEIRVFENPLLEALTRVHPAVPVLIWGPLAVGLVVLGYLRGISPAGVAGLTVVGLFSWTFVEYCLHRWVFHWEPRNARLKQIFYPVHQLHHEVQEWDRLLAPPMMAVPICLVLFTLFYWLLGTPTLFPFYGGFLIGYLGYDYIHYFTHFGTPRGPIGKGLRKRHLQHHVVDGRWFGVSSPLWDYVFRTHVPRGMSATEATQGRS